MYLAIVRIKSAVAIGKFVQLGHRATIRIRFLAAVAV
jgi:hypothetical protein